MLFKPFGRIISFSLLCSVIALPNVTLYAGTTEQSCTTETTAQDCNKGKLIARRVYQSICLFFTTGNPQHIVNAQRYLNSCNASTGNFRRLLTRLKISLDTLVKKMRSCKRRCKKTLEKVLTVAFDKFGLDVKDIAKEVKSTMGNTPEAHELAAILDKMPDQTNQAFLRLQRPQKVKMGIMVWKGF